MTEQYKVSAGLAACAQAACGEAPACPAGRLDSLLRDITRSLRVHYISANADSRRPPQDEWLCDNYYVLEKESKQSQRDIRRQLKRAPEEELSRTYQAVYRVLAGHKPPVNDDTVASILKGMEAVSPVSERQFSFLPVAMKTVLIQLAARGCLETKSDGDISYAVVGLGKLSSVDFEEIIQECSAVEEVLRQDPAGVYEQMDSDTRRHYRYLVAKIAAKTRCPELDVARRMLETASKERDPARRHVGFGISRHPALEVPRRRRGKTALAAGILIPLLLSAAAALLCGRWWVAPLCLLPFWEIVRPLISQAALAGVDTDFLPRMDLDKVEDKPKTAVLLSTLLPKAADAPALGRRLEQMYFSNSDPDLYYCVLADFKEWDFPADEKDESQVAAVRKVLEELNAKHQDRFMLFLRGRVYNKSQRRYSGWERKRGAITEFIRFLKGDATSVHTFIGNHGVLEEIKYLVALDADTNLLYESAQTLVSVALHPLNRPVIGADNVVKSGYGILAPKISTDLQSAKATAFSRVLSGAGGVTAYDAREKDFYQDLFGESIFAGKGLIDADCFYQVLNHRFPENQVLSHDILEGAYLRCGFVSDVEMTDQTPAGMTGWLARLHRWMRGDWQNLPFLAGKYQAEGRSVRNPIGRLSKYKIFDNLRRSVTPAAGLLCVAAAFFAPPRAALALGLAGVLSVTFASFYAAVWSLLTGGFFTLSRKFFTKTLSHTFELIAQGLFFLVMMPVQAFQAADAVCRSLWRTYVSRKKMLEWTTAAQSDLRRLSVWACVKRYWLPELFGLLCLGYAAWLGNWWLVLTGLAFGLVLPLAYLSALPSGEDRHVLGGADRDALLSYNAAMWRYYEDFANEKNNYLPPDNIQQSPVYRVAARTSPTNIGMMLLSVLAARDFDFIDTDGLYTRVERTIATVERLKTWNGNLYNWYDTETLETLHPEFVSTVDSGNFICCLVALKEGLREFQKDCPAMKELVGRIRTIIDGADLTPFYDSKKHLFSIGWDVPTESLSGSYYDFLMSEARLTSYYAVARKIVSKKHWGRLGRTMSRNGSYAGPVSWTGTMFEYYMPHLLLPVYEGSLLSEALIYCLYCHKKWAGQKDVPWGISESAFYAFDNNLNYQYKAHGVQKVGVKRYLDRELVISPYSTFITIPQNPNSSLENLRRLRELGVYGRYGFYEAVDFTPQRVGKGALAVTRSYMAHHIGMSMVASCNAVFDNRMQARFMRDNHMKSAGEFLQEKIAKSTVVYDQIKSTGAKDSRQERPRRIEENRAIHPQAPRCVLLTNGELTDILTDTGAGYLKFGATDLTRRSTDLLRHAQGVLALVRISGQTIPVTKAPFYDPGVEYSVEHQEQSVTYYAARRGLEIGMRCVIHPTISCQQRQLVIKNTASKKELAQVLVYLEPVLAGYGDYSAHPAFSKLFVTAKYHPDTKTLTYARRNRDSTTDMFLTVGFLQDIDFSFETRREALMSAPNGVEDLLGFHKKHFSDNGGGVPDACCALKFDLLVNGGGQAQATLLIAASRTEAEGVDNIISMRKIGVLDPKNAARSPLLTDTLEARLGSGILGQLLYPQASPDNIGERQANGLSQKDLWCTGISGDLPIALIDTAEDLDKETLEGYIGFHDSLRSLNVEFDLVFLYLKEETKDALWRMLEQHSVLSILGRRGGVHLLQKGNIAPETLTLLRAVARHTATRGLPPARSVPQSGEYRPMRLKPVGSVPMPSSFTLKVEGGVFAQDRFYVEKSSPLPWCHVLAASAFGTLVSDKALGFTWAVNSRENKLTPWYNDICADNQGELCVLMDGDGFFDLVNGSRASFSTADALYQGRTARLESKVRVTVSPRGCAKYIDVTLRNRSGEEREVQLAYYTEPVLGVGRDTAAHIRPVLQDRQTLVLQNAYNMTVPGCSALRADWPEDGAGEAYFLTSRASFLGGDWQDRAVAPQDDPCAAVVIPLRVPADRDTHVRFVLAAGRTPEGAKKMAALRTDPEEYRGNSFQLETPDSSLNHFINTFAPHQIRASRMLGRCAFYQCGGAYGFRDQLQDAGAYLLIDPALARRQILRCCSVQFQEGDVLHWWHDLPKSGGGMKGVRTRFSDDLLWLPLIVAEYVEKTGDDGILQVTIPYLTADPLGEQEQERYLSPEKSTLAADVFQHCARAIQRGCNLDERGLPRIGCGDWNDGFSAVGTQGKGTSVWLALFLVKVLERFAPLCAMRGERTLERDFLEQAEALRRAVDEHCWDGKWYLRAFFDDGSPMGSRHSQECAIDLLPQSFAVLAGMPDRARVASGMKEAWDQLVDEKLRLVRLFVPSFQYSVQQPGYVKAYPSGLRENGGQYTHSAVWFAIALLESGRVDDGWHILQMLNPVDRAGDPELAARYKAEPYYMPADIYTNPSAPGRAGWTMYTGAVSWYFRAVLEHLLGLRLRGKEAVLEPKLPASWPEAAVRAVIRDTKLEITIQRGEKPGTTCDGKPADKIRLDGGEHVVKVTVL